MKSYRPEKAPVDFTRMVMNDVHRQSVESIKYKPILGKWFLPSLGGLFVFFVILASFFGASGEGGGYSKWISLFLSNVPKDDLAGVSVVGEYLSKWVSEVPSVIVFVMLSATMLLILDRLFQRLHKMP